MYEVQINVNQKDLQTIKTKKENKQLVKDALRKSDTERESRRFNDSLPWPSR